MPRLDMRLVAFVVLLSTGKAVAQVTAVQLGSLAGLCDLPTTELLVLPDGFNRSLEEPLTSTADDAQLESLANCQFIAFDPSFQVLLGSNRTIYQLGGNFTSNVAFEGPVYLPGNLIAFYNFDYGLQVPLSIHRAPFDHMETPVSCHHWPSAFAILDVNVLVA